MSFLSRLAPFAAVAATFLSLAGSANADVLPPGCNNEPGDTCSSAGPDNDQPGVCEQTTCSRPDFSDAGADGGDAGTIDYPCTLCVLSDAGVADAGPNNDAGSSDGGAVTTRSDAGTDAASSDDGGGCSMSSGERDGATGFAMLALGVVGLAFSRRKTTKKSK